MTELEEAKKYIEILEREIAQYHRALRLKFQPKTAEKAENPFNNLRIPSEDWMANNFWGESK